MDAQHWDTMYRSREQVFSGGPNNVLVAEAAELPPGPAGPAGRALDVGCGEGGDALWLARRGWRVTAADVSEVALRRAATAAVSATDVQGSVSWESTDLLTTPPPADAFGLVSVHYFPLRRRPGHTALRGLLNAVAPGGTFLFATHALADLPPRQDGGPDPADYYQADDIARLLLQLTGPAWAVEVDETRPRVSPAPVGTHHTHDSVLRARRGH
ncbi:class I SAM-dependent methyltransferase [Streptomyces sp. NPDC054796]